MKIAASATASRRGRAWGSARPTWAVLLIGQYEGERWIFLAHAGYRRNSNVFGDRESVGELSGAVLYKATGQLKLLVDANRTPNARIPNRTRRSASWSSARSIPRATTPTWTAAVAAGATRRSSAR